MRNTVTKKTFWSYVLGNRTLYHVRPSAKSQHSPTSNERHFKSPRCVHPVSLRRRPLPLRWIYSFTKYRHPRTWIHECPFQFILPFGTGVKSRISRRISTPTKAIWQGLLRMKEFPVFTLINRCLLRSCHHSGYMNEVRTKEWWRQNRYAAPSADLYPIIKFSRKWAGKCSCIILTVQT
jgi:hypothetical protein